MLNDKGHEVPDPTPVALPVGFRPPPTMVELIRMHVRRELSQAAVADGAESFEEADDFDIEDDRLDPSTPYEELFEPQVFEPFVPPEQALPADQAVAPPTGASVPAKPPPVPPPGGTVPP